MSRLLPRTTITAPRGAGYPGDYTGVVDIKYAPHLDGDADPGEVVWGWIPYQDDHRQGKDRPSLVIGRDGRWLLVLMLTSKDTDRTDAADRRHEVWVDIGSGPWDRDRRPSEVRVDRIIRLDQHAVRREGAVLDRERFAAVAAALGRNRNLEGRG
ncbi:MAG: type II toxin-antitoxin system PemK/MazF family toxin [Actinomycetota bacterium]|nr:type II toxin-antitoxin system PemK/MazF family toxin [Actinomycetota bacterium]